MFSGFFIQKQNSISGNILFCAIVQVIETISLIFIFYGIVQGLILFFWLIGRKQLLLALFFICLSYLLFIFTIEINGWYKTFPKLIWTNVPVWFLPAPFLFVYAKRTVVPSNNVFKWIDWLHFLPALTALIYISPFLVKTDIEKIEIFENFYSSTSNFDYVQVIYFSQIAIYSVAGIHFIRKKIKNVKQKLSDSNIAQLQIVTLLYYIIASHIVVSIAVSLALKYFIHVNWGYYSLAFFTLSLTILISTLFLLNHSVPMHKTTEQIDFDSSLPGKNERKYSSSRLTNQEMKKILNNLDETLKETQLYRNPELKLADVSEKTGFASHHISQSLNQYYKTSFFTYINQLRIDAVKEQIKKNRHQSLTLIAIAKDCGFKSESSFYRIFKQFTGDTPGSYLKNESNNFTPK